MVEPAIGALRDRLVSRDCALVADAAEALVAAGAHFDTVTLAPVRACITASHGIGNRMRLARAYVALLDPAEAPVAAVRLVEESPNLEVRDEIFWALGDLGPAALPVLEPLLDEPEEALRWRACEVIRHIGGPATLLVLVRALEDDAFSVRWAASHGLIDAGEAAVPPLVRALVTRPAGLTFHRAARRVLRQARLPGAERELAALVDSLGHETTVFQSGALALRLLVHLRRQPAPRAARRSPTHAHGGTSPWRTISFLPRTPRPAES